MSYYLYRFATPNGSLKDECVVISDAPLMEVCREYTTPALGYAGRVKLEVDATSFPCDRALRA